MIFDRTSLWEHQTAENTAPPDPAEVAIPTAGWTGPDRAPFSSDSESMPWDPSEGLWVRRAVVLESGTPVVLRGRIRNAIFVYWDATYIGSVNPEGGATDGIASFRIVIPSALATTGAHQITALCLGDGTESARFELEADYLPGFLPLPPEEVRERLEWLTDIMEANDGSEERIRLRQSPRQSFEYTIPTNREDYAAAFNEVLGAVPDRWFVPVWTEARQIAEIAAGSSRIETVTEVYDYRADSLALIWESSRRWQIVGVADVDPDGLDLFQTTESFNRPWVMPVRIGRLAGRPTRRTNAYNGAWDLAFAIDDNTCLPSPEPEQFDGQDIHILDALLSGSWIADSVVLSVDVTDFELGVVTQRSPWEHSRLSRPYRVVAADAAEAWAHRLWLHRRAGRFRPFWSPSLDADLRVISLGQVSSTLDVAPDNYVRRAPHRNRIAVQTADGSWAVRKITAAVPIDPDRVRLTLDSALNIPAASILRVSYLSLRRLDTDRVELNWLGGGACQIDVRLTEIDT